MYMLVGVAKEALQTNIEPLIKIAEHEHYDSNIVVKRCYRYILQKECQDLKKEREDLRKECEDLRKEREDLQKECKDLKGK